MEKSNFIRIRHMIDASRVAYSFLPHKQKEDLKKDIMLYSALIRQLEILGEAAANIERDFRENYPEIPWHKIIGMRNRLIHAYFDVDPEIVWVAVTVEIPKIIPLLESIISSQETIDELI